MIGSVLDKYEVLQKVGEGGMATVYRGRHLTLGRDVAIKVLHPHLSATERNRKRFAREARAIEHMDHENILKIFDYSGNANEDCYIITEFVEGVTLHELLVDRGRMPSEVTALIAHRLADALRYAHSLSIIHRDLKPENVMLRRDGAVKLMDFGIAHFLDEMHLTVTGALVGSPAYMSPEQAMERPLDQRSDLFSLGTLLFHLVSGQLPFSGSNPSIVLRNIIDGNRPHIMELVPDISGAFADTIERLLQTDPNDRPHSADEIVDDLARTLADVQIDVSDPSWSLKRWVTDPDAYETQLNDHLNHILLQRGKALLNDHNHLEALRLFNRLLSMDEDNDEVLDLIQGMHSLHPDDDLTAPPERTRRLWSLWIGVPLVAGALSWVLWPVKPPAASQVILATAQPNPAVLVTPTPESTAPESTAPESTAPYRLDPITISPTPPTPAPPLEGVPPRQNAPKVNGFESRPIKPIAELTVNRNPKPPPQRAPKEDPTPELPMVSVEAPQEPGVLRVLMTVGWADVYIDGVEMGRTTDVGPIELMPGRHTLELRNKHAIPVKREFDISSGEPLNLTMALQRKPATILLPEWTDGQCEVILDGDSLGRVGQFQNVQPDRKHTVELRCPDGETKRCLLDVVTPGVTVPLRCP
ncbi:MAG: protein kinase [Myxococcota bacterium]